MVAAGSKALFHALGANATLGRLAHRYGLRRPAGPARQFIAGGMIADAVAAAKRLELGGLQHETSHLGLPAHSFDAAEANARHYGQIIETLAGAGVGRAVSVKLTHLGLGIDRATCLDNLRRVLDPAQRHGCFVRIDAEGSEHVGETLDIFEMLWRSDYRNLGPTIQARLRRSERDIDRVNALGASVRLVKGEIHQSTPTAHRGNADVRAAFTQLMETVFHEGVSPAVATHDPKLIDAAKRQAAGSGLARDRFEFQMFYGVRRDLQAALVADGYHVRVSVPFGPEWFPYFMHRIGDRPANLLSVARSLLAKAPAPATR